MAAANASKLFILPIPGKTAEELYKFNEQGDGGYFPIGANRFWHGAVHFTFGDAQEIVAVGQGRLLAYRVNKKPLPYEVEEHKKKLPAESEYSNDFVLLRHEHTTPSGQVLAFYSLYMHLLPWESTAAAKLVKPEIFRHRYEALKVEGEDATILAENKADSKSIVGTLPKGSYFTRLPAESEGYVSASSLEKKKKKYFAKEDIDGLYSDLDVGDEPDVPVDIPAGKDVTYVGTSADGNYIRISVRDESGTSLMKVHFLGEQKCSGYALLPKGFKASPIPAGTNISIQAPDDESVVTGKIRSNKFSHLTIKTAPWPPAPPPPPTATPGPTPDGGTAKPAPPPPPKPWYETKEFDKAKFDGYALVEYEERKYKDGPNVWLPERQGYADIKGRSIFIYDDKGNNQKRYKLMGDGLPVYASADEDADLLRVIREGGRITLKDPDDKLKDHAFNELADGGFILAHLTEDKKSGAKANIKDYQHNLTPTFGSVVSVDVPVRKGDCVGYAGPYLFDKNRVHFEIFTKEKTFLTNPGKDQWGDPPTLKIKKGAKLLQREDGKGPNPEIDVKWPVGSLLHLLEDEPLDQTTRHYKVERVGLTGWVEAAQLEKLAAADAAGNTHKAKADIDKLSMKEPSVDDPPALDIEEKIAKGTPVVVREEGRKYGKVKFVVAVEKKELGWTPKANVHKDTKKLTEGITGLHKKMPTGKTEPATDIEIGAGGTITIKNEKGKEYTQVEYKWTEDVDVEGWIDWSKVEVVPPPEKKEEKKDAGKEEPPPSQCKLLEDVKGLYADPPDPPAGAPDVKQAIKKGAVGAIQTMPQKQYMLVGVKLDPSKDKTGWVKLKPTMIEVKLARGKSQRYLTHSELLPWKVDEGSYHLQKSALAKLLTNNPNPPVRYTKEAGTVPKDVIVKPGDWSRWIEVAFDGAKKGWIKIDDSNVEVMSPYDWPGWTPYEEPEKYSKDGYCDVPDLLLEIDKSIDKDKDQKVSDAEMEQVRKEPAKIRSIKEAVADKEVAVALRHTACLHPTEWDGIADDEIDKWERLIKAPYVLKDKALEQTKKHIVQMQWWPAKAPAADFPGGNTVWHFHPIGFIQNLMGILSVVTAKQLKAIAPGIKGGLENTYAPLLSRMMVMHEINTPLRQAHFLAQVLLETGELFFDTEGASGKDYDYRYDLGNFLPNSGPDFKGRGLLQVTGRIRYYVYGSQVGEDLLAKPDSVAKDTFLRCDTAGRYWSKLRNLNVAADRDDFLAVTRGVNGAYNHMPERQGYLERAKTELIKD